MSLRMYGNARAQELYLYSAHPITIHSLTFKSAAASWAQSREGEDANAQSLEVHLPGEKLEHDQLYPAIGVGLHARTPFELGSVGDADGLLDSKAEGACTATGGHESVQFGGNTLSPAGQGGHGVVEVRQQDVVLDQMLERKPPLPVLLAKEFPGPVVAEYFRDVRGVEDLCRVRVRVTRLIWVFIRLFFRSALPTKYTRGSVPRSAVIALQAGRHAPPPRGPFWQST